MIKNIFLSLIFIINFYIMSGVILSDVFKWRFSFSPFHLFLSSSIIILVFLYYHNINKRNT